MYEAYRSWTFNLYNIMSTAAVFFDIEKEFDKTWHLGLLFNIIGIRIFYQSN
jgi:hypothetical protein